MPRDLDLGLLRTFVAIHECGSMSAAAPLLHLTQGAISQQVKRLESLFDTPVFDRQQRRLHLTEAGERLLLKARALLALNDQLWAEMTQPSLSGKVRFGVPYDLMGQALASALKAYELAWPQVEVTLMCGASSELAAAIERGELDLALVEAPVAQACEPREPRFKVQCLRVERLVWVGASGGSALCKQPLPVSLVDQNCAFRPLIVAALQAQGRTWRTVYESGNLEATCATVRADVAVTAWLGFTVPCDLQIIADDCGLPALPPFAINLYQRAEDGALATYALASAVAGVFGAAGRA
nr:LysR family transcriptional regulator [Pseudomonas sp. dw_358]